MRLNILCTSKPCDGLLYYSYEYASLLDARLIIIPHPDFKVNDYITSLEKKYVHCKNVSFEYFYEETDVTLIMGRSMLTHAWKLKDKYSHDQLFSLIDAFSHKLISVYSENHPIEYNYALDYFRPRHVYDLCDTDVYVNGVGDHFEKRINFDIYKDPVPDLKAEHMFLGTGKQYYERAGILAPSYKSYFIITYKEAFVNPLLQNIFAPVDNLLGMFNTYVYAKEQFDPAPRILQECMYFDKKIEYNRSTKIRDGGWVYSRRSIEKPNIEPIMKAYDELQRLG